MAKSMKERQAKVSDLLGLRDGDAPPDSVARDASGVDAAGLDAADQQTLSELIRLKAELNALPPVTPDAAVWEAIQERTGGARAPWLQRFPLATAASVFVAAALAIMLWNPTADSGPGSSGPQVQDPLAQLVLRSQRLESELVSRAAAPTLSTSTSEQALVYGIADVDAQLNAMYEAGDVDPEERERLWRQRVMLLESLAEVQRDRAVLRPAIY